MLELSASGRIGEKLTEVDKKNLQKAFLDAIPMAVQQYPFGDKKYQYSVIRLGGNHSTTYGRGRMSAVTDEEWLTIVKDSRRPNRWLAVEGGSTLYAQLARKCDALGLKQVVDDCGAVDVLRPIRSMRASMLGQHIKMRSPKQYALRWFLKLMEAGENISESEKALIRGRVKDILNYVFLLTDDEARLFIKTHFSDYGNTCADNAMEGLEQAEFAVAMRGSDEKKVFEAFLNKLKSEFVVGMSAVELFEDPSSGAVGSKPRVVGWGESIETKLYITLLLNEVIDMGLNGHAMLYPKCAYRPRADLAYRFFMQGFNGGYVLENLPLMPAFKEHACNLYVRENRPVLSSIVLDDYAEELVNQGKLGIEKARFYAYLEQMAQRAGCSEDAADGGLAFYDEIDRLKTQIAHNYTVKMLDAHYRFR